MYQLAVFCASLAFNSCGGYYYTIPRPSITSYVFDSLEECVERGVRRVIGDMGEYPGVDIRYRCTKLEPSKAKEYE